MTPNLYSKIEGQGFPLLILHGFLGMSDNWKTLASQYIPIGYQVHLLDLRNHGRSFHSDVFTYAAMQDDVVKYCQDNNLSKIDVIGHSMGGKLAMLLATSQPNLVRKLVVADIAPKEYPPHHQIIFEALNAVNFSQQPSRASIEETLSMYIKDNGTKQFLLKNLYWQTPAQLAFRFNLQVFNNNKHAIGEALPKYAIFNGQVLFIKGGNSDYINDSDELIIKKHFPKATMQTIPNVGHWLHAENPLAFYQITSKFLISNS